MTQLEGMVVGQYRLLEQIGRGGMATVYRAFQPSLDRMVAIKILPANFAHDRDFLLRFRREATSIARLRHPNILTVYDFGEDNGLTYIVMEYVSGGTLRDWLGKPLPVEWCAEIIHQIAGALDYAHKQGIVHRDVKPANVLMARDDWALLSDFGVAKIIEGSTANLTGAGVGIGTPEYMSPEQGQGGTIDGRSDIYSLGIMLFHMLTGVLPYTADTPLAVVMKHITGPLPRPRSVNPAVSEAAERVILKALAKNPDDRYQTAGEMAQALRAAAHDSGSTAIGTEATVSGTSSGRTTGTVLDAGQLAWAGAEQETAPEAHKSSRNLVLLVAGGAVAFLCLVVALAGGALLYAAGLGGNGKATSTAIPLVVVSSPTAKTGTPISTRVPTTLATTATPIQPTPLPPTAAPPTALPATPVPGRGPLLFSDDFAANTAGWNEYADDSATRSFQDGKYHITISKLNWMAWGNPGPDYRFQDIALEVTAAPVDGPDSNGYGVLFRYVDTHNFYCLELSSVGSYRFHKKENDTWTTFIDWTSSKAIKTGKQANKIGLTAKGKTFIFSVNDVTLGSINDGTFATGTIGLFATTYNTEAGVHLTFDDLKVWQAN